MFDVPSNLHAEMEVSIASGDMGTKKCPLVCQPLKDMTMFPGLGTELM